MVYCADQIINVWIKTLIFLEHKVDEEIWSKRMALMRAACKKLLNRHLSSIVFRIPMTVSIGFLLIILSMEIMKHKLLTKNIHTGSKYWGTEGIEVV